MPASVHVLVCDTPPSLYRYPGKRYTILGTNLIMERMKVSGLSRKENYRARFEALIKEATDILNRLFLLAAKNYRNYIIDQVTCCCTVCVCCIV